MDRFGRKWGRSGIACLLTPLLLALSLLALSGPASAQSAALQDTACFSVTPVPAKGDHTIPPFVCTGEPEGYQAKSLWYRIDPFDWSREISNAARFPALMVHLSRFDAVHVFFRYADGQLREESVRSGDFGSHWRAGGQIAFEPPQREQALTDIFVRFDRPAAAGLLRMRLLSPAEQGKQGIALAVVIGAALTLLAIGALYNLSLALASRRLFSAWQGFWAITMLVWGLVWSQLVLIVFPTMAGALSAQLCTGLSTLAIAFAAFSAVSAIEPSYLDPLLRRITTGLGAAVALLGIPLSFVRSGPLMIMADVLGAVILSAIVAVALCLHQAWRRGSPEARSYTGAWSLPMLTLALVQFIDLRTMFWGGGSQIVILCAATWQTLWLSIVSSRAHGRMRAERDHARQAEARAHELARRDPLTGLRNRRGLLAALDPMLEKLRHEDGDMGLLVVDIDKFKSINDEFGHEAGDEVLVGLARRLALWDGQMCRVARLGGEEFALVITGLKGFALTRFADSVRRELAACDHAAIIGARKVTVSIGVAQWMPEMDFRTIYRLADEALYAAKNSGRDRIVAVSGLGLVPGEVAEQAIPASGLVSQAHL